ncbi:hypothetical protein BASA61_000774 [Batrachochytrium salamandrivorans]|nr:hypothetical protein BASA61_000774 [Batrachochytrium salamandrivorans]
MMAAQAAVLSATSATSTTGVNLVKRAPTSDDEVEQSDTASQSSSAPTPQHLLTEHEEKEIQMLCEELKSKKVQLASQAFNKFNKVKSLTESIEDLKERRKGKPSAERTRINAALAEFEKELRELEEELSELKAYYELQADKYRDINQAVHENNLGYLREKYLNSQ